MLGFLLIGLSVGIPILDFRINMPVASNEWFFLVDSDDFDDFSPLFGNIALLVSLHDCGFDVVVVIISLIVGRVHLYIVRLIQLVILRHEKLYFYIQINYYPIFNHFIYSFSPRPPIFPSHPPSYYTSIISSLHHHHPIFKGSLSLSSNYPSLSPSTSFHP